MHNVSKLQPISVVHDGDPGVQYAREKVSVSMFSQEHACKHHVK